MSAGNGGRRLGDASGANVFQGAAGFPHGHRPVGAREADLEPLALLTTMSGSGRSASTTARPSSVEATDALDQVAEALAPAESDGRDGTILFMPRGPVS